MTETERSVFLSFLLNLLAATFLPSSKAVNYKPLASKSSTSAVSGLETLAQHSTTDSKRSAKPKHHACH